ncbi:tandem-95 repeat protein [Psychromonas sp. KJ10-10]|uniref:tandem-95 repeat protein n=1 Tax=Psychromonas sp. KJ10-10 TaxID=3391823 RepID=UPI0039B40777
MKSKKFKHAIENADEDAILDEDTETVAGNVDGEGYSLAVDIDRDASETISASNFDTSGFDFQSEFVINTTVTAVNNIPVANSDTATVSEDGSIIIDVLANDTDLDGQINPASLVIITPPSNGSLSVDSITGEVTYTPNANYNGTDNFSYTVQDDNDTTSSPTTVTLNVAPVNDAPELTVEDISTIEDGNAISGQATFTDIDLTDSHTFSVSALQVGQGTVSIDSTSGEYTYTPGDDFQQLGLGETTNISFDITVDDGNGGTDTETVFVSITGANDTPQLTVTNLDAVEDGAPVTGNVNFTDVDLTDSHTFSVTEMDAGQGSVSIDPTTGEYTFNPGSDFQNLALGASTDVSFDVTIDDGNGGTSTETVTVTVTGSNDAPVASVDSGVVSEDDSVTIDVLVNDTDSDDGDILTLDSVSTPLGSATIDANNQVVFTANSDFDHLGAGETQDVVVTYVVSDENGATSTSTATITVTGTNDSPELSVVNLNAVEDGVSVTGTPSFVDLDLTDNHTFSVSPMPANQGAVSIDSITGEYTYNPGSDFQSLALGATTDVSFDVSINDGNGGTDTETVTVTITGTNDAPALTVADLAIDEDTAISGMPTFTDIDLGDSHTFSVTAMPDGQGTVSIDEISGEYTFDPGADFQSLAIGETQEVTFDVTVDDGLGGMDTETVTVTITGTNDAPELTVSNLNAIEDGASVVGNPSFTDVDLTDSHTFSVTSMPDGQGEVYIDSGTGQYTYNPGSDFQSLALGETTEVTFDVTVTDDQGAIDTETVIVTITGSNDAPIVARR